MNRKFIYSVHYVVYAGREMLVALNDQTMEEVRPNHYQSISELPLDNMTRMYLDPCGQRVENVPLHAGTIRVHS